MSVGVLLQCNGRIDMHGVFCLLRHYYYWQHFLSCVHFYRWMHLLRPVRDRTSHAHHAGGALAECGHSLELIGIIDER